MHTMIVYVHVKQEYLEAFIQACKLNHEASVLESGNRRFDVLQSDEDSARLVLYEAYATATDAAAHKNTAHYRLWRDTVAEMMVEPRHGTPYQRLFPNT